MKDSAKDWVLFKAFLAAFALALLIGFVMGASERGDLARSEIISSMRLVDNDGVIYLGLKCHGKFTYAFNPDSQIIDQNPTSTSSALGNTLKLRTHKDVILAFVGGSTGAMTLQGIAKASASASRSGKISGTQKAIATILGAVSGYLIGYWTGTYSSDTCDSQAVASILSEPSEWNKIGRSFYWLQLHELGYVDKRFGNYGEAKAELIQAQRMFEEDPLNRCGSPASQALMESIERAHKGDQLHGIDYRALLVFDQSRDALFSKPAYREFFECVRASTGSCFAQQLCKII